MVLPLGRNVTLNFCVGVFYLTFSMSGFLPPMIIPKKNKPKEGGVKPPLQFLMLRPPATNHAAICDRLKPVLLEPFRLQPACGLRAPMRPPNSSALPLDARSRDSDRRCA